MARKQKKRIEPSFEGGGGGRSLRASDDDRLVGSTRSRKAKAKRGGSRSKTTARRRRTRSFSFMRLSGRLVYWGLVLGLWAGIAGVGVIGWYGMKMPPTAQWAVPERPPNIRIVSVDDQLIANRGMTGGAAIGLNEMSPFLPQAVIAIEDRRFYSHFGVDPIGLARAVFTNLTAGATVQGGSTLTQQLAKNLFLEPERTIERKVQEVLLAVWLEHKHSKDEILRLYLNRVYFGSGAYGVQAAARRYFDKDAADLTLDESALLAGLLKAPSRLSPARDPEAAKQRAEVVLAAMREQGMVSDSQFVTAMSQPVTRAAAHWQGSEHYVADHVMDELPSLVGKVEGDLVVETTVDLGLQKLAEKAIRDRIAEDGESKNVSQGALVSLDTTGAVRAMVGGTDYAASQFDRATAAKRQPGSTFKPFVYLTAIEMGWRPNSVFVDRPVRYGKWAPENYGGKYYGEVTLAEALRRSLNSVAAQLAVDVGPEAIADRAHRLGIESPMVMNNTIALGTSEVTPYELAGAYVPFASGGTKPLTHLISRVTDDEGRVLYSFQGNAPRVMDDDTLGMMNFMMAGTIEAGTGRAASFGYPAAGKTGTTQNSRDAWFVGYTADLVTAVWFGNDDGEAMKKVTGGSLPAVTWRQFMEAAHHGRSPKALPGHWQPSEAAPVLAADEFPARPVADRSLSTRIEDIISRSKGNERRSPAPPAAVGGEASGPSASLLDIILGNR